MQHEPIAITGIGCRFPGNADNAESFWKLLVDGVDAVCDVPDDRWNVERFYEEEGGIPGKTLAKRGGFIEGIDQFDPQFFGISPREAPYVDPQQRLLLETAYEAMEDGGIVLDIEKGENIGVFAGVSHTDYQAIQGSPFDRSGVSPHTATGSAHSIAANRISYSFNLSGPSMSVDTACSSALTAVHLAVQHLRSGSCTTALAGGVTVMITPEGFIGFSQASMLSSDGKCKAFDASADGFVRGEGAGMVLMKTLSQAKKDGDRIHGLILGSAVNQDGSTNGISLPCPDAQNAVVREACADAGVSPKDIVYAEAHGTGTAVGDPIEANALADALCEDRPEDQPLLMGSVKTNLGHLETAAGIAGLFKAVLMLKHRQVPANLHLDNPNPNIDFKGLKLRVPSELEALPDSTPENPLMIGINSFGFGGANAHVIVAEAPPTETVEDPGVDVEGRAWPVMLSARSEESLKKSATELAAWVKRHEHANGNTPRLPELTYTLGARRNHHAHRMTLTAKTLTALAEDLEEFGKGEPGPETRTAFAPRPEAAPRIGFVMSGQGPQWWGMGRELMKYEPVFKDVIEKCAGFMEPYANFSLLEELGKDEESSQMHRTEIAQPCIFAMQMGLFTMWKSWGVEPAAITGHSVGEIAAACAAGILTLEQGSRVIVERGRSMDECKPENGGMLAVGMAPEDVQPLIAKHDPEVRIAAFNGPKSLTLAGAKPSLEKIQAELEKDEVFARFVKVDHPFHHPLMEPAAQAVEAALTDVQPQEESVPFFSTVTGRRQSGTECTAAHWGEGVRQPVQFAPAVDHIADFGVDIWLEISAHPALVHSLNECLGAREDSNKMAVVASMRREREQETLVAAALELFLNSVEIDFEAMTPSRNQLTLPNYAWDKERWWNEAHDWEYSRMADGGKGFIEMKLPGATPTWQIRLDKRHMEFLSDHKVEKMVIFPAAGYVEIALEVGCELFGGKPFVIEDFDIRKPLILPEDVRDVVIEFSFNPEDRRFTLQSRMSGGGAWSLHVVGLMRGERTVSSFTETTFDGTKPTEGLETVTREEFYGHMADMGLPYGEEFKGLREVSAGGGKAAGKLSVSEKIEPRAGQYKVHPVLFDAALHVFSASLKTVDEQKGQLRLPVRFARIGYYGSPGSSAQVHARVKTHNEEYVEGRIDIYDAEGAPCVSVEGFRSVTVSGAKKSGTPGGMGELQYHIDWERSEIEGEAAPVTPVPLADLTATSKEALDEILGLRGWDTLNKVLVDEDDLAAHLIARGISTMLEDNDKFSADSLKVADSMRPVFSRLIAGLEARKLVSGKNGEYSVKRKAFDKAVEGADAALEEFLSAHPGHLAEGLLVSSTCAELGSILRADSDAVQVLFAGVGPDLLDHFYGDGLLSSHWLAAIAKAVKQIADNLPEGRGLRILEIGGGTAGLAAQVLPMLERGLHSYVFTDVSASFFQAAEQKLASFPEVEFKAFDLEKPGPDQDLDLDSFDLIIGTNVLHAVKDVKETLGYIHDLIIPGGTLMFFDTASSQLWTDAVFGLTSGWWRFTDSELRTEGPLLTRPQWEKAMSDSGFAETDSIPGLLSPMGDGEGGVALLARKALGEGVEASSDDEETPEIEGSWMVFVDEEGVGEKIATRLSDSEVPCRTVRKGDAFSDDGNGAFTVNPAAPADWHALIKACEADTIPDQFVYCWVLDEKVPDTHGAAGMMATDGLLHFTHALEEACPAAELRINLVTRGAHPVGRDIEGVAFEQSAATGVLRVMLGEHTNFTCRGIDLPADGDAELDTQRIWGELLREAPDREAAFRGGARYVQRLKRGFPTKLETLSTDIPLRLDSAERGIMDSLSFVPYEIPECTDDDVIIDVKAGAMNFRDVLKALGLYPAESADARIFGDEVAGVVVSVGKNVKHVKPGDEVFGLAVFGLATRTIARGGDVRALPKGMSFEEASTLPVVAMTSLFALREIGRIREGETVLIQAGAGGVGMAAIQLVHHFGGTVIATAGSPTKRTLLKTMGVAHVIDSRKGDFAESVMEITGGRGVDIVLNSMASEAIPMGLSCLAPFGRFLEIGKRDIYQNSQIPLWPMRQNSSFHVIAMDAVFDGDAGLTEALLADVAKLADEGALRPLPFRSFAASRVDAAFRLMAAGKHIGKVVVGFAETFISRRAVVPAPGFDVKADATYAITGAFGGFGRVLAQWLVDNGAKNLVLAGRTGASSDEAKAFMKRMDEQGINTVEVKADAGVADDIDRVIFAAQGTDFPLKGIFHLAMHIDDAPMSALDSSRMLSVIAPKAHGAWLLHDATKDMDLDAFVMFSSVSSILGNPGQANYAAANCALDALAHHRKVQGLPALVVNWGALGGEGYVARNERVAEYLSRQGTIALTPAEVTTLLQSFLESGAPQMVSLRVDWSKWRQSYRGLQENPLLEYVFTGGTEADDKGGISSDWQNRISAAAGAERTGIIVDALKEIVGQVLRVKPASLRPEQPLTDLGLDSLMAVEMETLIESTIGVALPPASLMQARTIAQLAEKIDGHLGAGSGGSKAEEAAPAEAEAAIESDAIDLDAISDDDLDSLLDDEEEEKPAQASS